MDIDSLVRNSLRAESEDFLNLINRVNQILDDEYGAAGRLRVRGRLVYLPNHGEAIVIGDIHGDLSSLKHILSESAFIEKASAGRDIYLIFLGDYGDRGFYSPEVYYVVLSLKESFPERVILLQGNHEGPEDILAYPHDLPYHLKRKFGQEGLRVYRELSGLFRRFYTAAILEGKFMALHGGVPSEAESLEDVAFAYEKHPLKSHLEEILWSDPVDGISGKYPSPRGAGYIFGEDVTINFLRIVGVKFLIRGHEPADNGYKIDHGDKILTLFSRKGAPYYNTHAAYLTMDLSAEYGVVSDVKVFIRRF
ncbi:MAG: metallophosphoesterase family protein [Candidatus Bathyarchaeia archaeon]|nr:serine/threonine protein phosphatase [Candidatus Bathyarchaeota archaeon]